jgi:hypothetical protein
MLAGTSQVHLPGSMGALRNDEPLVEAGLRGPHPSIGKATFVFDSERALRRPVNFANLSSGGHNILWVSIRSP